MDSNLNILTKLTDNNKLSSSFLIVAGLVAGCYLLTADINGNNTDMVRYTGVLLLGLMGLLILDAYYKNSHSEHYEKILTQKDTTIKQLELVIKNSTQTNKEIHKSLQKGASSIDTQPATINESNNISRTL